MLPSRLLELKRWFESTWTPVEGPVLDSYKCNHCDLVISSPYIRNFWNHRDNKYPLPPAALPPRALLLADVLKTPDLDLLAAGAGAAVGHHTTL